MTLLLLGGTSESRALADALLADGRDVVTSLAGATTRPGAVPGPVRRGGFGGAEGFRKYLTEARISAVLDATHPFAHQISQRSRAVAEAMGLPYCQLLRPPWQAVTGDRWLTIEGAQALKDRVGPNDRLLVTTGRQTLPDFVGLNATLLFRQIDDPGAPFPFPNGAYLIDRPPFTVGDEVALMQERQITMLVTKNAGGRASYPKVEAARLLGLPVAMIARPQAPHSASVETVEEALNWARAQ